MAANPSGRQEVKRNQQQKTARLALTGILLAGLVLTGSAWAQAGDSEAPFRPSSTHWRALLHGSAPSAWMQIGGQGISTKDEFGGSAGEEKKGGPSNLGEKFKAGLLSAVLPGAGQCYNGQHQKAYIMAGVEVAVWTAYFVFDTKGDNRLDDSRDFAGIYAGTSGSHDETYWANVNLFMDSDAYNEDRLREARATQEPVTGLVGPEDAWQWANTDRLLGYRLMRADAARAYDRRDFTILFAVLNRAVSVFDAVKSAGGDDPLLGTEVLGMNVRMEVNPLWSKPAARCVVSRGF